MESKDLNIIVGKKVVKAWRGYGFFISFDFGKTIIKKGLNKVGQMIEMENPEISLSIDDAWVFTRDEKNIIGTDLNTDSHEQNIKLMNEVDIFLEENFKKKAATIDKYEKEEIMTTIFFSNGLELKMNNKGDRSDDSDNWYLLIEKERA